MLGTTAAMVFFMDETFGVRKEKVFLFILMKTDEKGKGVLTGLFLVSPDRHAKTSHSSYNAEIIAEVIAKWTKEAVDHPIFKGKDSESIVRPVVGITDAYIKEKNAIRSVWGNIFNLTCTFHVLQAWRRKAPKYMGTDGNMVKKASRRSIMA